MKKYIIASLKIITVLSLFSAAVPPVLSQTRPTTVTRPTPPPRPPSPAAAPAVPQVITQPTSTGMAPSIPYDESPNGLNFQEASIDLVIMEYALRTGRTIIKAPNVPNVNITLRTTPGTPLSDEMYLSAIETVLNFNGISLEKDGDAFLRVIPSSEGRKYGMETHMPDSQTGEIQKLPEDGRFVSQMIELQNIDISEAQTIIQGFIRNGAQVQTFERTNSILVTD